MGLTRISRISSSGYLTKRKTSDCCYCYSILPFVVVDSMAFLRIQRILTKEFKNMNRNAPLRMELKTQAPIPLHPPPDNCKNNTPQWQIRFKINKKIWMLATNGNEVVGNPNSVQTRYPYTMEYVNVVKTISSTWNDCENSNHRNDITIGMELVKSWNRESLRRRKMVKKVRITWR